MSGSSHERPHNTQKLPFFLACLMGSAALAILFAIEGKALAATLFVVCAAISVPAILAVRSGRNPWWLRSRYDPPQE